MPRSWQVHPAGQGSAAGWEAMAVVTRRPAADREAYLESELANSEVIGSRRALVDVARAEPGRWWHPHELRQLARNGWSAGAMGIALDGLIARSVFEVGADQRVRLCE